MPASKQQIAFTQFDLRDRAAGIVIFFLWSKDRVFVHGSMQIRTRCEQILQYGCIDYRMVDSHSCVSCRRFHNMRGKNEPWKATVKDLISRKRLHKSGFSQQYILRRPIGCTMLDPVDETFFEVSMKWYRVLQEFGADADNLARGSCGSLVLFLCLRCCSAVCLHGSMPVTAAHMAVFSPNFAQDASRFGVFFL